VIALIERTPTGVFSKYLDVRADKSVEDVADLAKACLIGHALVEWWGKGDLCPRGGTNWWAVDFHPPRGMGASIRFDLRELLGRALCARGRISIAAGALRLAGHVPVIAHDVAEKVPAIGRDVMTWWANPGESRWYQSPFKLGSGQRGTSLDLRVNLNQAITGYEVELGRLQAQGKLPTRKG
jgi:hypothetical protein